MLLIWNMNKPLWVTGKTVIIESGFCVLKGFIGMYGRGVYGSAGANKRIYWPSGIYVDQINAHFNKNKMGEHECTLGNWIGVDSDVFFCKKSKIKHDNDVYILWDHSPR